MLNIYVLIFVNLYLIILFLLFLLRSYLKGDIISKNR
jgi:hypothetical protein